jgi:hypothetical protein
VRYVSTRPSNDLGLLGVDTLGFESTVYVAVTGGSRWRQSQYGPLRDAETLELQCSIVSGRVLLLIAMTALWAGSSPCYRCHSRAAL